MNNNYEEEQERGLIANLYYVVTKTVNFFVSLLVVSEKTVAMADDVVTATGKTQRLKTMGNTARKIEQIKKQTGMSVEELKEQNDKINELLDF